MRLRTIAPDALLSMGHVGYARVVGTAWDNLGWGWLGLDPDFISKRFRRLVAAAPVPVIRLHDLRHTRVAVLSAVGVPPRVISDRLGHVSVAFTWISTGMYSQPMVGRRLSALPMP